MSQVKSRFVVLVDWSDAGGTGTIYGTWETRDAAEEQADRWRRKVNKAFDDLANVPTIWTAEIRPKARSRFDQMLDLCRKPVAA